MRAYYFQIIDCYVLKGLTEVRQNYQSYYRTLLL